MRREAGSGTRGPRPSTLRVRKNEDERTVEDIEPVKLEFRGLEMTSSAVNSNFNGPEERSSPLNSNLTGSKSKRARWNSS